MATKNPFPSAVQSNDARLSQSFTWMVWVEWPSKEKTSIGDCAVLLKQMRAPFGERSQWNFLGSVLRSILVSSAPRPFSGSNAVKTICLRSSERSLITHRVDGDRAQRISLY